MIFIIIDVLGASMFCNFILFSVGALGYSVMEILFRGFTHWTMSITGGVCLVILWQIVKLLHFTPVIIQAVLGGISITISELIVGIIVNLWLGWNVWDYSGQSIHFLGQISVSFTIIWVIISVPICLILNAVLKLLKSKNTAK